MKKRGASEAIIFVLLVGFAVAAAIMVINWSTKHTTELTETSVEFVEKSMECDKIGMNVKYTGDEGDCSDLTIKNKGYLTINKTIIRSPEDNKVEVIPVIILRKINKEIGCKGKSITLDCNNPPLTIDKKTRTINLIPNEGTTILLP